MESPIILSVSEITYAIKSHLEPLFRKIWVRGEISNLKRQASGHIYFSLLEGGCQISAVMFRIDASALHHPINNGDTVIAEGELSLYPPRGSYQLIVRSCSHFGAGDALLKLQALKKKLQSLGWFEQERKKPLPSQIERIGLVTSPTGAVMHDIINVLSRRLGTFHLIINPVRVQGDLAANEIARAIMEFNTFHLVDVIVVCRGGGSSEDLSPFNEINVAKACMESTIPIVSAIGHETDLSITDLVADLRAPTPSAAAELISKEQTEQKNRLLLLLRSIQQVLRGHTHAWKETINYFTKRITQSHPRKIIEQASLRLDDIEIHLHNSAIRACLQQQHLLFQMENQVRLSSPTIRLAKQKSELIRSNEKICAYFSTVLQSKKSSFTYVQQRIDVTTRQRLEQQTHYFVEKHFADTMYNSTLRNINTMQTRLSSLSSQLNSLHPQRTLERGYAIVFRENKTEVIRSHHDVTPGEPVNLLVADGTIHAIITGEKND